MHSFLLYLLPFLGSVAAEYIDWRTYTVKGVNLGGWLCQESTIDTAWWAANSLGAPDEWGLCANQGSQCGPILERRYASFITPSDIDTLHSAGINTLRIPTTYAAWLKVPGSQLYTGNQLSFLKSISSYAINRYGMHVIIDVHSLPGGVNGMPFGEAEGHYGWFNNQTALEYSLEIIDKVIDFVQNSEHPDGYSIAPINEPVDNTAMSAFGTPAALSDDGAAWTLKYIQSVIAKVQKVNAKIPVVFQGGFRPVPIWSTNSLNLTLCGDLEDPSPCSTNSFFPCLSASLGNWDNREQGKKKTKEENPSLVVHQRDDGPATLDNGLTWPRSLGIIFLPLPKWASTCSTCSLQITLKRR